MKGDAETPRIFVSYRRADTVADAGRLVDTLQGRFGDDSVFVDVADIRPGENWERVVHRAMTESIALLLVVGPDWELSPPIESELTTALSNGLPVIPLLVRGADWPAISRGLPKDLSELHKHHAITLDHTRWKESTEGLIAYLDEMSRDPARARVVYLPPEPLDVLETGLDRENVGSLLAHAADLSECLDDATVVSEAGSKVPEARGHRPSALHDLVSFLTKCRERLMIEQLGRDLLEHSNATDQARYLQDSALVDRIRARWDDFESEKREWYETRGDGTANPRAAKEAAEEAEALAATRLQSALPGLTKESVRHRALVALVKEQVIALQPLETIQDYWHYAILKHASFPDLPWGVHTRHRSQVDEAIARYERDGARRPPR